MKLNFALILSIIIAVGIVAFGFTFYQTATERYKLNGELKIHTSQIAKDIFQNDTAVIWKLNKENIEKFTDSIVNRHNISGIAIYYNRENIISNSYSADLVNNSHDYISKAITANAHLENFIKIKGKHFYQYIIPIHKADVANIAVIFYTESEYINNIIGSIWLRNFLGWFFQALIVSVVTVLIIRWGIFSPIKKIVDWIKIARKGNLENLSEQPPPAGFLTPLHTEIVHIAKAMNEAKAVAEEETRLRANAEAIWTPERLRVEMETLLQNKKMIVVSNREPYMHIHEGKNIKCIVPASGLITAMEPILKACGGLWFASGTGDADKETVDENDKVTVPPENPVYTLKRLWLTKEEEEHFYYGFSNEGLWPLCHIAHVRPIFRKEDWKYYKKVNEKYAKAILEETANDEQPFILIQDYHFSLLPELIKKTKPDARVAIFWHIPWPNPESFGIIPWQKEILRGMLGADIIGFHTQYHCNHFLETVNNSIESLVRWENFSVKIANHITVVKPFPISIDFTLKDYDQKNEAVITAKELLQNYGVTTQYMGVGVDRIDYTKGINERFWAIERFLEKNPDYIGKFTFVQIGAPSRTLIKSYSDLGIDIDKEVNRINQKFKTKSWKPILYLNKHHSHNEIVPFFKSSDFCMVTSLHDGMNLVAKEYVATRNNNNGVLILSRFAGAANELQGALIINPYDIEKSADSIKLAIEMTKDEQENRMKQMRQNILVNNIYLWASNIIKSMASVMG